MTTRPRRSLSNAELRRPSALQSIPRNPEYLWLDKNENLDPQIMALAHDVLRHIPPTALATYPEAGELYRKLAAWVGVSPEHLLLTPGSDGAIRVTFEAFVEHGDGVIHTSPTFAMYPVYSQMFGAQVRRVEYKPRESGPFLDPETLIDAVRELKPKLVCLPNPDSPSGTVVAAQDLRRILRECEDAGAMLLLDEAYHPFYEESAVSWTESSPSLVIARTFAKAWGVAGLRVGYAAAHPETIALLHKMRPMYEVSTLAVEFMTRMLDNAGAMAQAVERINGGKAYFAQEMRSMGFRVLPSAGNFVHVAFDGCGEGVHAALSRRVLYRASSDHPSLAGYSRFTIAPRAIMAEVVDLIREGREKS